MLNVALVLIFGNENGFDFFYCIKHCHKFFQVQNDNTNFKKKLSLRIFLKFRKQIYVQSYHQKYVHITEAVVH